MRVELTIVALGALWLLVHIFAAGYFKTRQYGADWNMGARDEAVPPLHPVAARLVRAQANFLETFPIAVAALIGVVVAGRASGWSAAGGWLWLAARVIYLPLYGYGVPKLRTLVFMASLIGLGLVLWPLLV